MRGRAWCRTRKARDKGEADQPEQDRQGRCDMRWVYGRGWRAVLAVVVVWCMCSGAFVAGVSSLALHRNGPAKADIQKVAGYSQLHTTQLISLDNKLNVVRNDLGSDISCDKIPHPSRDCLVNNCAFQTSSPPPHNIFTQP